MDMRIPPLNIKILLESNPLESRILVRRLAVHARAARRGLAGSLQARARRRQLRYCFPPNASVHGAARWFYNPHPEVVPRSRIPRSTPHFSHGGIRRLVGGSYYHITKSY